MIGITSPVSFFLTSILGFDCTEEENTTALTTLRKRAWLALRAKIDEQTSDAIFLGKLRTFFEERFRYDDEGTPRVWKPEDDIDGAFKKAKEQACLFMSFTSGRAIDKTMTDS